MKVLVGGNHYYSFSVDVEKNRQYLVLRGYWEDASDVIIAEDFLRLNRESIDMLKPGFTTLIDISELEAPSEEMVEEIIKTYSQRVMHH